MYLTEAEYTTITGEAAPDDFDAYLAYASAYFDLQTMAYFAQLDLTTLPDLIMSTIQKCIAYEIMNVEQSGGVGQMIAPNESTSITLGKFSLSGGGSLAKRDTHPVLSNILPLLLAYMRGVGVTC